MDNPNPPHIVLAAGLPIVTAVPLIRYVRGKAAWVALPLLVVVTMLPVWTVVGVSQDLWEGPIMRQVEPGEQTQLYLAHTRQSLGAPH